MNNYTIWSSKWAFVQVQVTTTKDGFNMGLFLHYLGLKPLLSHLPMVTVSPAKPSLGKVFSGVFLNLGKSLSEPLLNTISLRTFVKYHGFQNLCKIPWVSNPPQNTIGLKTSIKYHGFKNLCKIPWVSKFSQNDLSSEITFNPIFNHL